MIMCVFTLVSLVGTYCSKASLPREVLIQVLISEYYMKVPMIYCMRQVSDFSSGEVLYAIVVYYNYLRPHTDAVSVCGMCWG